MSKRWGLWLLALALAAMIQQSVSSRADTRCTGTYAPGTVLIGFREGVSAAERHADLNVTATIPGIGISALRVPTGQECAALETLRHDPRVAFAELDYAVHATDVITPNDPGWPSQWGPARIQAPVAWGIVTGTADVVIAILDSGVKRSHQDLADNLWTNPGETPGNGIDDDGNGKTDDVWGWHFYHEWAWDGERYTYLPKEDDDVSDDYGHGTHVSGIAAARINNGVGIAGIAGGSRLMTVKVLDQHGNGWYSDVALGIVYAVDNGARIVNLSLGGAPTNTVVLQEAVNYAHAHGTLVVAATGNDGGDVLYPAACEHVIAIAAVNQNDRRPAFSNHGPRVDVAAPGVDIYSTWYTYDYFVKSGTSMAAPHVSGLAALIWSARPDLTTSQVTWVITSTTADVNGSVAFPGWDEYLGWGRIEAGRALSATMRIPPRHYLPVILCGK